MPILGRAQNASVFSSTANVMNIGVVFTLNSFIRKVTQSTILAAFDDAISNGLTLKLDGSYAI